MQRYLFQTGANLLLVIRADHVRKEGLMVKSDIVKTRCFAKRTFAKLKFRTLHESYRLIDVFTSVLTNDRMFMETVEAVAAREMEPIENDFVKMWIEDGIMFGKYKPGIIIDIHAAKKVVEDRIRMTKGEYYPALGYVADIANITKEARDFFSRDEGIGNMKKLALLTSSPISKMLGNFYLRISKPTIPTSLFTDEKEAIAWLKQ